MRNRPAQRSVPVGLMTLQQLLNSDLSTIVALLRQLFDWWIGQLRDLIPARLREDRISLDVIVHATLDGHVGRPSDGVRNPVVVIPHAAALVRDIAAPAMSRSDAKKMVSLDIDRYFPVPTSELLVAIASPVTTSTGTDVSIAAINRTYGWALATSIAEAGLKPARIMIGENGRSPDPRFDLLPPMRDARLIDQMKSPAPMLWAVVGFLAAFNIGLAIWRDAVVTGSMRDLVEAQAPAARIVTEISQRLRRGERVVALAQDRRSRGGVLAVLDVTTRTLPMEAWVQRLTWQDDSLRLAGYRGASVNVVTSLKRNAFFAGVRNASGERLAATTNGQPFDVVDERRRP